MAAKESGKTRTARKLGIPRFKPADQVRTLYCVTVEEGVTQDDVLESSFWSHVAAKLIPGDRIEVRCDDESFFGELLVLDTGKAWVKVHPIFFMQLGATTRDETGLDGYIVKYRGPHAKWSVLREEDKTVLHEHMASREEAVTWAVGHKRTLAA